MIHNYFLFFCFVLFFVVLFPDPTFFGNLSVPSHINDSLISSIKNGRNNGYAPSQGTIQARQAIAEKYSTINGKLSVDDIFITSGCSGALAIAIEAVANEGENIILPKPVTKNKPKHKSK